MHDPEVYPSPNEFRPERFIRDGKVDTSVRDPAAFVFGSGRRSRVMARRSITPLGEISQLADPRTPTNVVQQDIRIASTGRA